MTIDLMGPSGPLQAVTAGGGLYSFPDLYPGGYTATVDGSTLPAGHFPTFDLDGVATPDTAAFTVLDGQPRTDAHFGYQPRLDLVISKDDDADPLPGGDSLTYTITVENLGPAAANDVTVTDVLPAGMTLIATAGCAEDPVAVPTCTLGDLGVGAMASYSIEVSIDPMPPASITNTASVAALEFDLASGNDTESETTTLDALPPTVVLVDSDASTADALLTDCENVHGQAIYRLRVQFDDQMLDPAGDTAVGDVTNPQSWLLAGPGPDGSFSTVDCGGLTGDDVASTISSITCDEGTSTATLQLASPLDGLFRLFACGSGASFLRDRAGNGLDGDADGTGGDDFLRFFRADPFNALDGHFDCELAPWVAVSTNPSEITHSSWGSANLPWGHRRRAARARDRRSRRRRQQEISRAPPGRGLRLPRARRRRAAVDPMYWRDRPSFLSVCSGRKPTLCSRLRRGSRATAIGDPILRVARLAPEVLVGRAPKSKSR